MDDSKRRKRPLPPPARPSLTPVPTNDWEEEDSSATMDDGGVSLEELSQSYQRAIRDGEREKKIDSPSSAAQSTRHNDGGPSNRELGSRENSNRELDGATDSDEIDPFDLDQSLLLDNVQCDTPDCPLTPQSILEAVFFVGRSDNSPISAAEIATLIRGVDENEVIDEIAKLNETYAATNRATTIAASGGGYRLQLAVDLSSIRDRFYGTIRKVKLNQAAVDCLALISYQPGISREKLEEQRGQSSGSLLTQLIRRQLIEMRRETDGKKQIQRYYPTERFLDLAGIESLDDLPQTEDFD